MGISGKGWEFHLIRLRHDERDGRERTVGKYQIYHDGKPAEGDAMSGATAETRGPGDNDEAGNNRCIEPKTYRLSTQDGEKYKTLGYEVTDDPNDHPKPGILVDDTGNRGGIVIHPGVRFLSSVGCVNPCEELKDADSDIDFEESRDRVIAIINDMKKFLGDDFPDSDGELIKNAHLVIEEEFENE